MAPAAPVKVIHLITLLEFGGAQGNTIHTVQNLDRREFDAFLWTGKGAYWDSRLEGRVRFFPMLVRPLHPFYDLVALIQLWRALREEKPAILHTHSSKAGILGRIAGWMAGVPLIIHSYHGFGFNDRQKPWTRALFVQLEKLTACFTDVFIFVSKSNWELAKSLGIGNPQRYRLIRSGVPLQKIKNQADETKAVQLRSEFNIPPSAKIVSTIGAFKPQKNLFDFIAAAKIIAAEVPDAHFFIIGDGSLRPELERRVIEAGLKDRVKMPGWREDAVRFLACSDVFVMTSLWEGLPRALVEAMSIGVPSVCYDTDGVRDLLGAFPQMLIRQGDVTSLAACVTTVLKDRRGLSDRMREAIGPEFDIDGMVRQQEELYRDRLKVDNLRRKH